MSKISIIVPVYNGKGIVDKCLNSIFAQSLNELEVIIVDDGSTDGSYDYIKDYVEKNNSKSFEVNIISKPNGGIADARNYGIEASSNDYLMFVDHDDYFDSDYCAKYLKAITKTKAQVVVGGYERVKPNGTSILVCSLEPYKWCKYTVQAPWAHIYDAGFIKSNGIRFLDSPIGEDVYFNLLCLGKASKVTTINDIGYKWLFNKSSVSNSRQNIIREDVDPIYLLENIYKDLGDSEFRKAPLTEYFFSRYVCWYMLFSSRGSSRSDIEHSFDRLHGWLSEHYPNYLDNPYIRRKAPKGELKKTAFAVRSYYRLYKLGVIKKVLKAFGVK